MAPNFQVMDDSRDFEDRNRRPLNSQKAKLNYGKQKAGTITCKGSDDCTHVHTGTYM